LSRVLYRLWDFLAVTLHQESIRPIKMVPDTGAEKESLRSVFLETAVLGQGGRIAGAMQNSDDHKLMLVVQVVDGVVAGETDAQPPSKVFPRRRCKREVKQPVAIVPDLVDEARRCCL
jgi:hypothetical protein